MHSTEQHAQNGVLPVVVAHGYLAPRSMMEPLRRRLCRAGLDARTVDLPFLNLTDVYRCADGLARGIESVLEESGSERCDVVGVSLGGLLALHYVLLGGGRERVRHLVGVATPFKGTWAALAAIASLGLVSRSAWQLTPRSRFIRDLQRPLPPGLRLTSIYARWDPIAPASRCRVEGARNIELHNPPHPLSHQALVLNPDVGTRVVEALLLP